MPGRLVHANNISQFLSSLHSIFAIMLKQSLFISCVLVLSLQSSSQCPNMDSLHKRVFYLGNMYAPDFAKIPQKQRLAELFGLLEKSKDCPGFVDSIHVYFLRNIASVYRSEDDFINAIAYYQKIIKLIRANYDKPTINRKDLITMYFWLVVCYEGLHNTKEKLIAIDSCIQVAQRLNSSSDIACLRALYARVEYSYDIGDYQRCVNDAERCGKLALEYIRNGGALEHSAGIPIVSSSLGWQVKALLQLKNYKTAEELLANKLIEFKNAGLLNYFGMVYQQLAEVEMNKGNYDDALIKYNLSVKYDHEAGYDFNCKQTTKDLGYFLYYSHFKDNTKALLCFRRALTYINKDRDLDRKDVAESLDILADMANIFAREGKFDSAFTYYQLAFDQIRPGTNEMDILKSSPEELIENRKIHYLTSLLIDKADAYLQKFKVTKDLNSLNESIRVYRATDLLLNRNSNSSKPNFSQNFSGGATTAVFMNMPLKLPGFLEIRKWLFIFLKEAVRSSSLISFPNNALPMKLTFYYRHNCKDRC